MCLVLKLDNGKVVSIAEEQTYRQIESQTHPLPYWYIDIQDDNFKSPNLNITNLEIKLTNLMNLALKDAENY